MYFLVDAKTAGYPTKNIPNYTPFPLLFKEEGPAQGSLWLQILW